MKKSLLTTIILLITTISYSQVYSGGLIEIRGQADELGYNLLNEGVDSWVKITKAGFEVKGLVNNKLTHLILNKDKTNHYRDQNGKIYSVFANLRDGEFSFSVWKSGIQSHFYELKLKK